MGSVMAEHDLEFKVAVSEDSISYGERKIRKLGKAAEDTGSAFDRLNAQLAANAAQMAQYAKIAEQYRDVLEMAEQMQKASNKASNGISFKRQTSEIRQFTAEVQKASAALDNMAAKAGAVGDKLSKGVKDALGKQSVNLSVSGASASEIKALNAEMERLRGNADAMAVSFDDAGAAMDAFMAKAEKSGAALRSSGEAGAQSAEKQAASSEKAAESNGHMTLAMAGLAIQVARANTELLAMAAVTNRAMIGALGMVAKTQVLTGVLGTLNFAIVSGYLSLTKLQNALKAMVLTAAAGAAKVWLFINSIDKSKLSVAGFVTMLRTAGSGVAKFVREFDAAKSIQNAFSFLKSLPSQITSFAQSLRGGLKSGLDSANTSAKNFVKEADTMSKSLQVGEVSLGKMIGKLALIGGAVAGAVIGFKALTRSFDAIVEIGKSFEQAITNVAAVKGLNLKLEDDKKQFQELQDEARRLGEVTVFSAKQSADAMYYLGLAGFSTGQILKSTEQVLSLAAASGTELARTSDIASDLMTAFGKTVDDLPQIVDVFAKTMTTANTNLEQFYESAKYVAPVATQLGISMEEVAASIGIAADSGSRRRRGRSRRDSR